MDFYIEANLSDVLNYLLMSILVFIYYFVTIYSKTYLKYHRTSNYFEIMFNIFFISMAVFIIARNLATTFLAWEFLRITSFLLISFYTLRIEASKSSIKALLMNKIGNITLIFALIYVTSIFYTNDNSLINSLLYFLYNDTQLTIISALLIICAMTKCAQHIFIN